MTALRRWYGDETARGGKNLYGVPLGILVLQSRFPRIPGDVGNAATWPFPVLFRVVEGATPDHVVRRLSDEPLVEPFLDAAKALERDGVSVITTGCGFLVLYQRQLQDHLDVPIITSSLLQVPWVAATLPAGGRVGVLTVEKASLTPEHLAAAGVTDDVPCIVGGLDEAGGHFTEHIVGDNGELDVGVARAEHVRAARQLVERYADVAAIVLECTNMPPYADSIAAATGRPVYDLTTLVGWAVSAARRGAFHGFL